MLWEEFKKPENIDRVVKAINSMDIKPIKLMEVCGTHTMSIAKSGIKSLLPPNVKLISGPGCPVCVTPMERIDHILKLAENKNVIIATYGDMLKVPGSERGKNLDRLKALGANVEIVYSAMDAVEIARLNPSKEVVFLGIGFETTVPASAGAIQEAYELGLKNFYIFSMHKIVEPVMRGLIAMDGFDVDGFLCPGHVAVIIGEKGFRFLTDEYKIPSVISGFEAGDILTSVYKLMIQINNNDAILENEYTRGVRPEGNIIAQKVINKYFEPYDDLWRGIGLIEKSGLKLRREYKDFDAVERFSIKLASEDKPTACNCGEVVKGLIEPMECKLFGTVCTPENPVGPCMVSSEGSCAACYKYGRI